MPLDLTGVDLATETVRTERLVLCAPADRHVDPIARACQDPENQRWLTALPFPYTREDAVEFVHGIAARAARPTGRLGPEIGYWTAPRARRQGYAAEAAAGLARWALDHGAPRVHLYTDVANTPSQAVAERVGFAREGVVRSCPEYRDGSRADAILFGRLPS